jgi:hypothetical protein
MPGDDRPGLDDYQGRLPEFLREHLPGDAAAEDKQNAGETRPIEDARPSACRPMGWRGQERFDKGPQRIRKQRGGHTRSRVSDFGGFVTCSKSNREVVAVVGHFAPHIESKAAEYVLLLEQERREL